MNQDPKEVAAREKLSFSAVPPLALRRIAEALNTGVAKYGRFDWRSGRVHFSTYFDATLRHLLAYSDGERCDPESGLSHLAHAAASLCVLLDAVENAAAYRHDGSRPFFEARDPRPEAVDDRRARQARAVYGGKSTVRAVPPGDPAAADDAGGLSAADLARMVAQTPAVAPAPAGGITHCLCDPGCVSVDEGTGSGITLLHTMQDCDKRIPDDDDGC